MSKIKIDVEGVDKTLRAIERDIHRGMERSVETLVDNAKDRARQIISEERAIFNAEVYAGFKQAETRNTPTNVRAKLYNDVDHADALEHGATYKGRGPPVAALLPWVARKMRVGSSFNSNTYNGGGGPPDSFGDDGSSESRNETLDVAGETRTYPEGWDTHDPTTVERVSRDYTFEGQEVELLDVSDESFARGTIYSRRSDQPVYTVELDSGEYVDVNRPSDPNSSSYKIIATENFYDLDDDIVQALINAQIDDATYQNFNDTRAAVVREHLKESFSTTTKDRKHTLDVVNALTVVERIEDQNKLGSMTRQSPYRMKLDDAAGRSDIIHEGMHGVHYETGYRTDTYPTNDYNYFGNLFDEDGNNITQGSDATLYDLVLSNGTDHPGIPDDGSVPDIIKERVGGDSTHTYTTNFDVNELLAPGNGNFNEGDRLRLDAPNDTNNRAYEHVGTEEYYYSDSFEFEGEFITAYKLNQVGESHDIELWVDDNGDLVNMRGIVINEYAEYDGDGVSIPEVELQEEDPWERLVEAVNLAYAEQLWIASQHEQGIDTRVDEVPLIGREYSTRAANEVLTTITELLKSSNPSGIPEKPWLSEDKIIQVHENYPYLIRAWLEYNNPSNEVEFILDDLGYDI